MLDPFCNHGQLRAVDEADLGQLQTQTRRSGSPPGFLRHDDASLHGLATVGDDEPVGHQRMRQRADEVIARQIVVARNWLIHSNRNPRAGRQVQLGRGTAPASLLRVCGNGSVPENRDCQCKQTDRYLVFVSHVDPPLE
jgi:hypothetical protein